MNEIPTPLPPHLAPRIKFPKCQYCKRRPQIRLAGTGADGKPTYEKIPCCSAKYLKTINDPTRLQKIRLEAERELRESMKDETSSIVGLDRSSVEAKDAA